MSARTQSNYGLSSRCLVPVLLLGVAMPSQAQDGPVPPNNSDPWFVRGDINQDRGLDLSDAVFALEHLFLAGSAPSCTDAADANDDGDVDLSDPVWLLAFSFLAGPSPAQPFPDCGPDPTPDELACEVFDACPRELFIVNSLDMRLVYIPAGSFLMGARPNEVGRRGDETQHRATLTCGFYMGQTEVTQAQYVELMGGNPSHPPQEPQDPVNFVTWNESVEFCRRLSVRAGGRYRLPTEAEWEYACRAGTTTRFWFGEVSECDPFDTRCEVADAHENFHVRTVMHPVAAKEANPWGLYDMHGNAPEWVIDWYDDYPTGHVIDPFGPPEGSQKVFRGTGSWRYTAGRSATRASQSPAGGRTSIGFRVVLEACDHPSPVPSQP